MDDKLILKLYAARDEQALLQTQEKYGKLCHSVAYRILYSHEDAEECVNDTLLRAWESIPPHMPNPLSPYVVRISRNVALERYRLQHAEKRGGEMGGALEELGECVTDTEQTSLSDSSEIRDALNGFLSSLSTRTRIVFLRRYWYLCSVAEIAQSMHMTEGNVKVLLHRTRKQLKAYLEERGICL